MPGDETQSPHEEQLRRLQTRLERARAALGRGESDLDATQELETAYEELRVAAEEVRVQQEQIEELRGGQQALRQQHDRMLANLEVPAVTTGTHGIIRTANAAAARLGDARVDRLVGKPVLTLFSVEARHDLRRVVSQEHPDGASYRFQADVVSQRRGATEVVVTASVAPGLEAQLTWLFFSEVDLPHGAATSGVLPGVLARLATLPAAAEDVPALLDATAAMAMEVLGPNVSLTVTYGSPDDPTVLSSTDPVAQELDGLQIRYSQGPCLDAFTLGRTVVSEHFGTDGRWPALSAAAPGTVGAVVSVPLTASGQVLGALNVYCTTRGSDPARVLTAEVLGATIGAVLHEHVLKEELRGTASELSEALTSRAVLDQAKGMVMADRGCDADEAFAHLARMSSRQGVKVRDVARDLVARRTRPS